MFTCLRRGRVPTDTREFGKPVPGDLSAIIRSYKSAVTREVNIFHNSVKDKIWQGSFYDRIIRNEKELFNIRRYIEQNPLKWELEKDLPDNL